MKKKMFMMLCLAILGIQVSKAQQSIIALHHEGNVTIFSGSKTQEAMDASVKGDTLYLSEGTFAGWDVTHGIVVLGSGERTVMSGNITITGNDEKKDLGGYVFSGLNLLHDFVVNDSVNGLKISQCQMNNFTVNADMFLDSGEIIMSFIGGNMDLGGAEYGLDVLSSKINIIRGHGQRLGSVNFNHCNINSIEADLTMRVFQNCIIKMCCGGTYQHCLFTGNNNISKNGWAGESDDFVQATKINCFKGSFTFDDDLNCSLSNDDLIAEGYLGDDGSIVGITGGEIPYTLELATPHIVDHKLDVDNVNRKLTVTLKMAHESN